MVVLVTREVEIIEVRHEVRDFALSVHDGDESVSSGILSKTGERIFKSIIVEGNKTSCIKGKEVEKSALKILH